MWGSRDCYKNSSYLNYGNSPRFLGMNSVFTILFSTIVESMGHKTHVYVSKIVFTRIFIVYWFIVARV